MNRVVLVGRTTKEPEASFTNNGLMYCAFTLAVDSKFKKDHTNFIRCKVWSNQADNFIKYAGKGSLISVEGELTVNTVNKDGEMKTFVEVNVDYVKFISTRNEEVTPF